ncbi:MAG: hypothetical protein E4H20_01835 [Spirochaetales bacterium]|nr:MAG: hypothetical protein E4H20_01835 [Spirochaetales bacterium]
MQTKNQRGNETPIPTADQELEKYGVWVKAEPQDIVEEPETEHEFLSGSEATLPSFDDETADLGLPQSPETEDLTFGDFDLPDVDEEPSLEEPSALEELEGEEMFPSISGDSSILEIETIGGDETEELSIEELESNLDEDIIDDSVIDIPLDELEESIPEPRKVQPSDEPKPAPAASQAAGSWEAAEEISLEDFGFSDDNEPLAHTPPSQSFLSSGSESGDAEAVDLSEFGIDEDMGKSAEAPASDEFEAIDIDLQFDDTIPAPADSGEEGFSNFSLEDVEDVSDLEQIPSSSSAMEDVTADFDNLSVSSVSSPAAKPAESRAGLDSFIDSETDSDEDLLPALEEEEVRLDAKSGRSAGFDDVHAVESELAGGSRGKPSVEAPSSDLLKTIAAELSAIKDELVSMRSQLGSMKAARPQESEEIPTDEEAAGGFFDEEEDDTIALTGDELDNILNTADFTEESASGGDDLVDETVQDILPENGDYSKADATGIEPFGLDIEVEESAPVAHELAPGINHENIEVTPLTELTEDTSYLEADEDLPDIDSDLEGDSLVEQPLVEPDEADLIMESDEAVLVSATDFLEESLPELESGDELDLDEEDLDELVLSIDGAETSTPTAAVAETPINEIEDDFSTLEELGADDEPYDYDLHSEESANLTGDELSEGDMDLLELEEVEELEAVEETSFEDMDRDVIKPSQPVDVHPDEIAMTLDDSFFVEPEEKKLELSAPSSIQMPSFGSSTPSEAETPFEEIEAIPDFNQAPQEIGPIEELEPMAPPKPAVKKPAAAKAEPVPTAIKADSPVPDKLKGDIKSVLVYLDQLLASLPEEKIEEFASSEYYETYRKLFDELGLL